MMLFSFRSVELDDTQIGLGLADAVLAFGVAAVIGLAHQARPVPDVQISVIIHAGQQVAFAGVAEVDDALADVVHGEFFAVRMRGFSLSSFEPNNFKALSRRIRRLSASDKSAWSMRARCMAVL